jgi:hypothetical protein
MRYIQPLPLLSLFFLLASCGDADAIKRYTYQTTKDNLEKAVTRVIESNPHILLDTSPAKVTVRRNPGNINDTSTVTINLSEFHNKDSAAVAAYYKGQLKMRIKVGQIENYFTVRYLGDEQYWSSSSTSAIFISEVSDGFGNSLSQGHNENGQFKNKMAKEFTKIFEREVVDKVDKELRLKHAVD